MGFKFRTAMAVACTSTILSTSVMADEFRIDRLFVVGDSLSDAGTYSQAIQAGAGGMAPPINYRFTDNRPDGSSRTYAEVAAGELGIDLQPNLITGVPAVAGSPLAALANDINVGGTDFAQGGARVALPALDDAQRAPFGISQTPVTTQVDRLIASTNGFTSNDLVILWAGANDVLANAQLVGGGMQTPQAAGAAIGTAATQMIAQVDRVIAHGATNIVVVTVPDIGTSTPLGAGSTPQGAGLFSGLTAAYNNTLVNGIAGRATVVDSTAVLNAVLANPVRYGFSNVNQLGAVACPGSALNCLVGVNSIENGQSLVFADPVHPSSQAHVVLGQLAVRGALVGIGQVGVMPVATISALRQQSIGLEQRLNLGAFFINDETGTRIRRPIGNVEVYGGVEGGFYSSDQQQVVPGFDAQTQVIKAAADVMVTDNILLGVGGSIDHGQVDFDGDRGGFDSRLFVGGVFGVAQIIPGVYVNGFLGGGLIDIYDINRNFQAGASSNNYEGDTDGTYFIARTNVGAVLPVGDGFFVNPSVGFAYERVNLNGYQESAQGLSPAALQASVGDLEYVGHRGTVALAGFYRPPAAPTWTLGLRASWEHDFNDDDVQVPIAFGNVPASTQTAPRPDDSYGFLSATVTKELTHTTSATLTGSTVVGQDGVDGYTIGLILKHSF